MDVTKVTTTTNETIVITPSVDEWAVTVRVQEQDADITINLIEALDVAGILIDVHRAFEEKERLLEDLAPNEDSDVQQHLMQSYRDAEKRYYQLSESFKVYCCNETEVIQIVDLSRGDSIEIKNEYRNVIRVATALLLYGLEADEHNWGWA